MTRDDVAKLASLARIRFSDEELEKFTKEFDSILAYVGQIENTDTSGVKGGTPVLRNVFRKDGEPHESGIFTKKLVEEFPSKEDDYLVVKQIIQHD